MKKHVGKSSATTVVPFVDTNSLNLEVSVTSTAWITGDMSGMNVTHSFILVAFYDGQESLRLIAMAENRIEHGRIVMIVVQPREPNQGLS